MEFTGIHWNPMGPAYILNFDNGSDDRTVIGGESMQQLRFDSCTLTTDRTFHTVCRLAVMSIPYNTRRSTVSLAGDGKIRSWRRCIATGAGGSNAARNRPSITLLPPSLSLVMIGANERG